MPVERIERILTEFDSMQGLRLLVSGGEPPLHPQFAEINELFDRFSFRTIILSNGTLFEDRSLVERLKAHEVQVSLDGVGPSHDLLRGAGSYEKALDGLQTLASAGIDVSVATMAHAANADDFDELEAVVKSVGAKEWNIDAPAKDGRWGHDGPSAAASEMDGGARALSLDRIEAVMARGFGGGAHFSGEDGWGCGAHLCAVMADGTVCKCGFYANSPVGSTDAGLQECWRNIPRLKTESLRCDCDMVEECRGGCRYRAEVAGDSLGVDAVMCAANGLPR
jgi:radical SAM protein with 4Fe4S-binding SPASM domain